MEAPRPKNAVQVKAFMGLVNYYGRFVPDLATIAYPLMRLLKKQQEFHWDKDCEEAFLTIRDVVASDKVLVPYSDSLPVVLATDASPYGVSAVLSHVFPNGDERPITFASRTLSSIEQRYSQIDKEALSIMFGVKRFFEFLYGRRFTLVTDHKPLVSIFAPDKSIPALAAARMQHYALYLQGFQCDIKYRNTELHGNADALSRLPCTSEECVQLDEAELFQLEQVQRLPMTYREISAATKQDTELQEISQYLKTGAYQGKNWKWGGSPWEFTLQENCILRGHRVVVPKACRQRVLQELHRGHFGTSRMKALSRGVVWWLGLDKDIEHIVKNCTECLLHKNMRVTSPVLQREQPERPWQRVHIDYAGPTNGEYILLCIDAFSKWPGTFCTHSTSTNRTIELLSEAFSRFGFPETLVSDNGPQFKSKEFEDFLQGNGIKHKVTAPFHPATNVQADRYVQTIKKDLQKMGGAGTVKSKLQELLMQYRKMPTATTGKSPAALFLGREIRTLVDLLKPTTEAPQRSFTQQKYDKGQKVLVRQYGKGKEWAAGEIVKCLGPGHHLIRVKGALWKRHINQMHPLSDQANLDQETDIATSILPWFDWKVRTDNPTTTATSDLEMTSIPIQNSSLKGTASSSTVRQETVTRSGRSVRPPNKLT